MRVLILLTETGGGHRAVAGAVERGLRHVAMTPLHAPGIAAIGGSAAAASDRGTVTANTPLAMTAAPGMDLDITTLDLFTCAPLLPAERMLRLYGPVIRFWPRLYGLLFWATNRASVYDRVYRQSAPQLVPKVQAVLRAAPPDVIVSVHPLCNRPALDALDALGRRVPVLACITELVTVHTSWVEPRIALYTAATEAVVEGAVAHGADRGRIRFVGLPVNPRFGTVEATPQALRARFGLAPDRFTVLIMGGGEGTGAVQSAVRTALAAAAGGIDLQLLIVCGRNRRLQQQLQAARERQRWRAPARIFGFVHEMPALMQAADVVVTKGGPQSVSEALVTGRPVLVTQVLPGQEEGNDRYVEQHGAGLASPPGPPLIAALQRLATDVSLRQQMAAAARRLARPDAAEQVARLALDLA